MSKKDLKGELQEIAEALTTEAVCIGDNDLDSEVTGYISTQCPLLDVAIGRPGIPVGRLSTIIGQEASGKSSLGQHILAETQRRGGIAILADTERRYWKDRATRLGINQDLLLRLKGETVEEVFTQIEKTVDVVREKMPDRLVTIVWDSIAGTVTKADIESNYGDHVTAPYGRVVGPALRKIHPRIAHQRIALVFINQLREEINFGSFGRPKMHMVAEKPLTYWSSLKINLIQIAKVGDDKERPTGIKVQADIVKNTIAPPFRQAIFEIDFLEGIDYYGSALDAAVQAKLIPHAGGWYSWKDQKFRRVGFREILDSDEELRLFIGALPEAWCSVL